MPLPRVPRSLLYSSLIATLLVLTLSARAAAEVIRKPYSFNTKQLVFTPANLRFGNVAVGQRKVQNVTIINSGSSDITLVQVTTQGKDFTLSGLDLPLTLASGESFTFSGVFAPRSRGYSSGSISFLSDIADGSTPILRSVMTGTGVEANGLDADPTMMDFGNVPVGSMAIQGGTLAAAGKDVTISSATSSSAEFTLSGVSFPLTIPAWGSQGFTVTFTPRAQGVASATLFFMNVSGGSPLTIKSLNGVGIVSQQHRVDLSWKASTSDNVIGYNVYRRKRTGGRYRKINAVLDASTVYTDTSVTDRNTYYYVTTAVNWKNEESVYSKRARATIP
jgi:Transmembrane protein 131-like N-terminal